MCDVWKQIADRKCGCDVVVKMGKLEYGVSSDLSERTLLVLPMPFGGGNQVKMSCSRKGTPMSAKRPAESSSNAEKSKECARVVRERGVGLGHARPNEGSSGKTASARPKSESSMLKRMHSRGRSAASGVDSREEDVDAKPWV